MNIPQGEVVHFDVTTCDPSTGAVTDADSAPGWKVFEEDSDTAIQSGTMTKRTTKTGNYRASVTVSAGNGFDVGKWYSIVVSATVDSTTGKQVLKHFRLVAAEQTAGYPRAEVDKTGYALTTAERNSVADAVLSRNVSTVEASAPEHCLGTVVLATLQSSITGATWTIKRTNGTTTHVTKTVTSDADALPITGVS